MNYKFLLSIVALHVIFIISGYFVLQYAVFLVLSQIVTVHIFGYLFLLLFLIICVLIHFLVVDLYGFSISTKKKWAFSVSGMFFSTFVSFLFLAFLF